MKNKYEIEDFFQLINNSGETCKVVLISESYKKESWTAQRLLNHLYCIHQNNPSVSFLCEIYSINDKVTGCRITERHSATKDAPLKDYFSYWEVIYGESD